MRRRGADARQRDSTSHLLALMSNIGIFVQIPCCRYTWNIKIPGGADHMESRRSAFGVWQDTEQVVSIGRQTIAWACGSFF